ncbi:G5 domain-containing protein, partial [Streptococcus sp. UMB0029]|uniref:G5 domain-containing protein n=1 Tax=Streptococcus sp. UMB0029 TaxID=2069308 RepID=UPI000CAB34FD
VIDTTTYEVDPKTGKVTPTTVRTYGTIKEPIIETRPVPSPVIYEKDDTKEKGTAPTTVKGEDGEDTITTIYTVDPNTGKITASEGQPVRTKEPTNTIVKVAAKDKVETTEILSPKKYVKDDTRDKDQPNVEEAGQSGSRTVTTTYEVNPADGTITERAGEPVVVNPTETIVKVAAKDKVVETLIEPEVEYVRDGEREVDTPNERVQGAKGKTVTTTTYDVDPKDGHITEHVGNPVVTPAGKTIVKVGAKTKVEQSKDPEGRDVIDTTTYEVDPKTGKVTPTTVRTYGTIKEPIIETRPVPSPVIYEKDDTKEKGTAPTTVKGEDGEDTITTIYTVDPNTGKITASEGQPVRTKEPTNTIVKVAAKDKVETTEILSPKKYVKDDTRDKGQDNVEEAGQAGSRTTTTTYEVNSADGTITERVGEAVVVNPTETIVKVPAKDKVVEILIEPEVEYVKDVEKDFGTPDQRTEGKKGKTVTTTTYDVDPNDGHITEHVGNPVVTLAGKTIVKVGAKTKVEQSKDSEGRDVIDTTSYEVDLKTGKVTPTTVRTYGTSKETKIELEQSPKTGDVTVTPKKPDDLTYPSGTKVEIPGEDGKGKVPNSDLPEGKLSGTSKITEPDKSAVEVPNVTTPAKVTIFENGVLADSIALPELMIEVLWIDEDGNVLKQSVKTGNEKDAGHGLIPGYEFVRTMIDENAPVMTHIFRKVGSNTNTIPVAPVTLDTLVTPATNGGSDQDIPAPTTPNAVNSNVDQVDTHTTIDNGAKSNDSQNVLPNTGTESNATLASLGLLGMLGGLGLALGKKKED